jgi:hypothetical protein
VEPDLTQAVVAQGEVGRDQGDAKLGFPDPILDLIVEVLAGQHTVAWSRRADDVNTAIEGESLLDQLDKLVSQRFILMRVTQKYLLRFMAH